MIESMKALTLSTAHLSPWARDLLDHESNNYDMPNINVFPKGGLGWFIYWLKGSTDNDETLPDELKTCIQFADDTGHELLIFDRDAEPLPYLKTYPD